MVSEEGSPPSDPEGKASQQLNAREDRVWLRTAKEEQHSEDGQWRVVEMVQRESSDVFGLVGSSVRLDTQHPVQEFDDLSWVFNRAKNVLKYYFETKKCKHYSAYEGRVEFNNETYSLTLKNLQRTDSGLYEAKAAGIQNTDVVKYRLSVLDPVEAPVLASAFHQLSDNTCNITLTCRGHDLSLNSSCHDETCEEKEVTLPGGITLSLSVNGSSIICNHSNPVSWKEAVLEMGELKQLCADKGEHSTEEHDLHLQLLLLAVVVIAVIILLVIFISFYLYQRKSTGPIQCENTVYAEVERNGAATPLIALEAPSTVYSVIKKKPQPTSNGQSSQTTPVPENQQRSISAEPCISSIYESVPDQIQPMKPGTIYATVSNLKAVN
ncbi:SLAM family member 9-like [Colossoma macropomum]|uniref:SLAM family member 9-like n=1 Tax=Colossoma macropomum TaxID=42526 RepID=UPI001864B06F|nr:SLAM family member 9-like [Colossoma macropomum]